MQDKWKDRALSVVTTEPDLTCYANRQIQMWSMLELDSDTALSAIEHSERPKP